MHILQILLEWPDDPAVYFNQNCLTIYAWEHALFLHLNPGLYQPLWPCHLCLIPDHGLKVKLKAQEKPTPFLRPFMLISMNTIPMVTLEENPGHHKRQIS